MKIVSRLALQTQSTGTARRCSVPWAAAGWHTGTALLGPHWQLGCPFSRLSLWFPLAQALILTPTGSPGKTFHPAEAGWKFFTKMVCGECSFHDINVYHGKRSILPEVKQNGSVFLQGSWDLYLIHLSPQGSLCPSRVIAIFTQLWLAAPLWEVQPSS